MENKAFKTHQNIAFRLGFSSFLRTTLLQVGHEKRREDYEKRLQLSEQQLEDCRGF